MHSSVPPPADAPGRLGAYELLLPIGTGGMATVYLARREIVAGAWREFALKLLHPQLRAEPRLAEQLLAEARLVASIRHPNVVQVMEAEERPEGVYLAMEYVEGDTLAGLIRAAIQNERPIPIPVVGRIVLDGLLGLHAAHEARAEDGHPLGLVHRDFSPQNLLVGCDGITRLADFGIAKVIHRVGATATGIVKGKVSYMAPEQARGESLDRRCDVWAAGVVLWEALACRRLFAGSNDAAAVLAIVAGDPPPRISSARPEVGAALDGVVAATLERNRAERIGDALELRRRLEAALAEHGIADPAEVAAYVEQSAGEKLRRRREAVAQVSGLRRQLDTLSEQATRESFEASGLTPYSERAPQPGARLASGAEISVDLGGLTGETAVSSDLLVAPVRGRRRARWALAAGLLAGAAAVGLVVTAGETTAAAVAGGLDDASRLAAGALHALEQPLPEPRPPASAAPAVTPVLAVEADAPVAQLHVGDRSIAMPDPRARFEVPLTAAERARTVEIEFVAGDRRRVAVPVTPGQTRVEVRFPPLRRPQAAGPKTKGAGAKTKGPDIVDNPYGAP